MLRVSSGEAWPDAILAVLPSRKGAVAKGDATADSDATETDALAADTESTGHNSPAKTDSVITVIDKVLFNSVDNKDGDLK